MTASEILNIQGGSGGGGRDNAVRRADDVRGRQGGFDAALLRFTGFGAGAAAALNAQVPPVGAQGMREGAGGGGDGSGGERDASDQPGGADATAGAPLTIDDLNAMLLVGGGTRLSAGHVARGELRTAAPKDGADSAAQQGGPEPKVGTAPTKEASVRAGAEPAASDEGQGQPRVEARAEPGRETAPTGGREPGHEQRGDGHSGRNEGRGREGATKPGAGAASSVGAADPLRALAARGLGAQAAGGVRGIERGAGANGTSTIAVRSVAGASRGVTAARAEKGGGSSPAATAARREALAAQMSRILTTAAAKGGGTMTMRLAPESLGAVTVRVGVEEGVVTARFEAANAAARDLLDTSMSALRSSLEAKGLSVERLHVELAPQTNADRAPEDQGADGGWSEGTSFGGGGGGGSAEGRAGESGARGHGRGEGAERPVAEVSDDRTDAIGGTGHLGEALRLGLDAVA